MLVLDICGWFLNSINWGSGNLVELIVVCCRRFKKNFEWNYFKEKIVIVFVWIIGKEDKKDMFVKLVKCKGVFWK